MVCKSIKLLANAKYFGLGCLFGVWIKLMKLCVDFLQWDWKDALCEDLKIWILSE